MLNYIRNIDKNPIIINYAQTALGKLTVILIYAVLMHSIQVYPDNWQIIIIFTITAITFAPQYRHLFIFAGMLSLLFQNMLIQVQPDWDLLRINYLYSDFRDHTMEYTHPTRVKNIDILLMLFVSELIIFSTSRFKSYKIMQYPIAFSYLFVLGLIGIAGFLTSSQLYYYTLWSFILVYIHYFWFIAYTILEKQISKNATTCWIMVDTCQFGALLPYPMEKDLYI